MRFSTMILHNVLRRNLRSGLTVVAVAIAVGSVVALVGIANGFKDSFMEFYQSAGVDIIVTRSGSQRRLTSTLNESLSDRIQALPGVKEVVPGLADVVSFADVNLYVSAGLRLDSGNPCFRPFQAHGRPIVVEIRP